MSEMVERVARAIALYDGTDWDGVLGGRPCTRNRYRIMSRAAIEAMREPTEGMIAAANAVGIDQDPRDYWPAMIDEALK